MGWTRGDLIGKGAYGEVFLAIPSNPDFPIMAVKSAPEEDAPSLVVEQRILEKFQDVPGVVQCLGGEFRTESSGRRTYYMLMEFAARGPLVNLIGAAGIPESHVREYARMILRGLSAIHSRGYIHCDVKPGNILAFPPSQRNRGGKGLCELKIADFGLATETRAESKMCRGTVRYVPPELVLERKVSPAMDVWALGCTVIEMLTGNVPWSKYKEDIEILRAIAAEGQMPEIPVWLSEQGKDFLRKCFVRNPTYRVPVDRLLRHPFVAADYGVIGDRRTTKTAIGANGRAGMEKQRAPVAGLYPLLPHEFFQQGRPAALMC